MQNNPSMLIVCSTCSTVYHTPVIQENPRNDAENHLCSTCITGFRNMGQFDRFPKRRTTRTTTPEIPVTVRKKGVSHPRTTPYYTYYKMLTLRRSPP